VLERWRNSHKRSQTLVKPIDACSLSLIARRQSHCSSS
jgi:hypothetical protein